MFRSTIGKRLARSISPTKPARRCYSAKPTATTHRLPATAIIAVTAVVTLAASQLWSHLSWAEVHAESVATTPSAALLSEHEEDIKYADKRETGKVIAILKRTLGGDKVTTDEDDCLAHGQSPNTYHAGAAPSVVVYAESTEDVSVVLRLANEYRIPVTPYSGGTSLEGHITCPYGGICVDLSRMDKVLTVHLEDGDAVVQAGVRWEDLNEYLKDMGSGLFFPLDPGPSACLGGMMATGCSGTNAVRYGTAKGEWFLNATVVLPNGDIIKTRQRSRKSSAGYDLTKLFIGAEGTLGIVTQTTIKLAPILPTSVAVCGFPGVEEAVSAVREILNKGVTLQCVELCDTLMMSAINRFGNISQPLPVADSIFFKFQGPPGSIAEATSIVHEIVTKYGGKGLIFAKDEEQSEELWRARKAAHWSAMALVPGGTCYSTDVCVPVGQLARLVKETKQDLEKNGIVGPLLGHVGDGNFHAALIFDPTIPGEFEKVDEAAHRMVERAISLDGTCTGEHGVGIGKRMYLRSELGDGTLAVMKTLKKALDPRGIMNPGKLYPD